MTPLIIPVLLADFGVADFITGRDYFARLKIPGRSIWYVAPVLTVLVWLQDHRLWPMALAWAMWRGVLGWSSFGGRMDPQNVLDVLRLLLRNLVSAAPAVAVAHFTLQRTWAVSIVGFGCFCIMATMANIWLSEEASHGRDADPAVDAMHGAAFGLTVATLLLT